MEKFILLDMDGVMVPVSSWKPVALMDDGFYDFHPVARQCLEDLLAATSATIILTTSHRTRFSSRHWQDLMQRRVPSARQVLTLDEKLGVAPKWGQTRLEDVMQWALINRSSNYVIIDDDASLEALPAVVKDRWVRTASGTGLQPETAAQALVILMNDV